MENTQKHSARNSDELPLWAIESWSEQPRKRFDESALAELAESIKLDGLLEPIIVRPIPKAQEQFGTPRYLIVAGERRHRACKMAGLESVPVRIRDDMDDATALKLSLVENLQRKDLDPVEEAEGYRALMKTAGMKQIEIAAAVNRSQPAVANALRLLELPDVVLKHVQEGRLSRSHGIALVKYAKWSKLCTGMAAAAVKQGLTSKTLEKGVTSLWDQDKGVRVEDLPESVITKVVSSIENKKLDAAGITHWGTNSWDRVTPDVAKYEALAAEIEKKCQANIQRHSQKALDAAKAEGKELIKLKDLDYRVYERVGAFGIAPPKGCTANCECRAKAIDHGGEVVWICTNPQQYQQLKKAMRREESKTRKAEAKSNSVMLDEILSAAPALDVKGLAVVAADRIFHLSKPIGKQILEQFAAGVVDPSVMDDYNTRRETYDALSTLPIENIVQILVHGTLLDKMHSYLGYSSMAPELKWYMVNADVDVQPQAPMSIDEARSKAWSYLRKRAYGLAKSAKLEDLSNGQLLAEVNKKTEPEPGWDWPAITDALRAAIADDMAKAGVRSATKPATDRPARALARRTELISR